MTVRATDGAASPRAPEPSAKAELLPDRGAAAADPDEFFRSPELMAAEGVTHTLAVTAAQGESLVPIVAREIPAGGRDAISPYGYPGARVEGRPPEPGEVDWSATGLVSAFLRERVIGAPCLEGPTERSPLMLHDPARPRRVRRRLEEQCRAVERRGYEIRVGEPGAADAEARRGFLTAYSETMARVGAAERYRYGEEYLERVLSSPAARLVSVEGAGGITACAAILVRSDGCLHYYLGGTAEAALADSPFKRCVWEMLEIADAEGLPLNLGGGLTEGDGLERFKRGFANTEAAFRTHELVLDRERYEELSPSTAPQGFFPAYRAT